MNYDKYYDVMHVAQGPVDSWCHVPVAVRGKSLQKRSISHLRVMTG
jgi:hypothetical protein